MMTAKRGEIPPVQRTRRVLQTRCLVQNSHFASRWLEADDKNVAVMHCRNGRRRTCTVLACVVRQASKPLRSTNQKTIRSRCCVLSDELLVLGWQGPFSFCVALSDCTRSVLMRARWQAAWLGVEPDPEQALQFVARRRGLTVGSLAIPSQMRYLAYFKMLLSGEKPGVSCCQSVRLSACSPSACLPLPISRGHAIPWRLHARVPPRLCAVLTARPTQIRTPYRSVRTAIAESLLARHRLAATRHQAHDHQHRAEVRTRGGWRRLPRGIADLSDRQASVELHVEGGTATGGRV